MSVSTLSTVAAVRGARPPTKGDIGKAAPGTAEADQVASVRDLLVTAVPTEVVALYTAAVAILVGGIKEPSAADPAPSEYALWRWLLALSVVAITAFAVHQSAKGKQDAGKQRRPGAEVLAGGVAAAGWALALPESPLTLLTDDDALQAFFPALAALVAVGTLYALGKKLQQPAR